MKQNKLIFESENLQVDYISFKFQKLENSTQRKIADYLFKLGFNSYKESGKLSKPIKESILVSSKNKFEVCFVADNPYWDGTLLHFSGLNAARFYFFLKEQIIDWTIFSSAVDNTTALLEPVLVLGIDYKFVIVAASAVEWHQRIATLASFMSASMNALTTDPMTNVAIAAVYCV